VLFGCVHIRIFLARVLCVSIRLQNFAQVSWYVNSKRELEFRVHLPARLETHPGSLRPFQVFHSL